MNEVSKNKPQMETGGKSIKVLHLIDSGGLYGAEKMLLALVDEQLKQGLHPVILSAGNLNIEKKSLEIAIEKRGYPLKIWRMNSGLNLNEAWKISLWAQKEGVDILHSHGYKFNILMGLLTKRIRNIPLLITVHGYTEAKPFSAMWIYQLLDKWVIKHADKVIFVSNYTENLTCFSSLKLNKKEVIFNGIMDEELVLPHIRKNWVEFFEKDYTRQNCDVLIAVGRLSPEKGLFILLEAFSELTKQNSRLRLVLFGEGELRKELECKAELLGITSKMAMPGYVENIEDWIASADVLVMPSYTEGMPITLLEAMRAGVRIVASNVGGIPELLKGYASHRLVSSGNPNSLAEEIRKCFDGTFEHAKCDLSIFKEFTKNNMVKKYSSAYRDTLKITTN